MDTERLQKHTLAFNDLEVKQVGIGREKKGKEKQTELGS